MDISSDDYKSIRDRPDPYPNVVYRTVLVIVERLVSVFTLTDEDRSRAGIFYNDKWHDR